MKSFNKKVFLFYFTRIFFAAALTAIFCMPLSMLEINLYDSTQQAKILFPFSIPILREASFYAPVLQIAFFSVYLIPLTAAILITSIFVKAISRKLCFSLVLKSLSVNLFCSMPTFTSSDVS